MWKMTKEEEHSWKMRKLLSKAMESAMNNDSFIPQLGQKYFNIHNIYLVVNEVVYTGKDSQLFDVYFGNCFQTKKEAEDALTKLKL